MLAPPGRVEAGEQLERSWLSIRRKATTPQVQIPCHEGKTSANAAFPLALFLLPEPVNTVAAAPTERPWN